jgi:hypothetical protein
MDAIDAIVKRNLISAKRNSIAVNSNSIPSDVGVGRSVGWAVGPLGRRKPTNVHLLREMETWIFLTPQKFESSIVELMKIRIYLNNLPLGNNFHSFHRGQQILNPHCCQFDVSPSRFRAFRRLFVFSVAGLGPFFFLFPADFRCQKQFYS